jgi:hypothetical protein
VLFFALVSLPGVDSHVAFQFARDCIDALDDGHILPKLAVHCDSVND